MKSYTINELLDYPLSLSYNDISMIPRMSSVKSRREVDLSTNFLRKNLQLPILSAPMPTVSGKDLCKAVNEHGGLGVPSREYLYNEFDKIMTISTTIDIDEVEKCLKKHDTNIICLDTANAANTHVLNYARQLKKFNKDLIVGNFANPFTIYSYCGEFFNFKNNKIAFRIGIGNGSACTTSLATGVGVGQASLIASAYHYLSSYQDIHLIADGGIKTPGDIVKAIALGADVVMSGRLFASTYESSTETFDHTESMGKLYAGAASKAGKSSDDFIEGHSEIIQVKGPVSYLMKDIKEGLSSALSYLGFSSLQELKENRDSIKYVILSNNSIKERGVHI